MYKKKKTSSLAVTVPQEGTNSPCFPKENFKDIHCPQDNACDERIDAFYQQNTVDVSKRFRYTPLNILTMRNHIAPMNLNPDSAATEYSTTAI